MIMRIRVLHGDDSDSSGSDEVDVHALPDYLRDIAIQHATWFIEQKYGSKGTEAQVSRSMTICRLLLEKANADRDIVDSIPADFQQALRRIKHLVLDMDQIDACVKDHHLFRDDSVTVCPYPGCGEARYDRNGNARRAAFYVKPEDWLSELLTTVKICQQFDYMRAYIEEKKFRGEADDELRDFFSGSIFKDVIDPYIRAHGVDVFKTVVCGMCFDEVAISRWPTKNICPVLLSIYNCPPWIRNLMTMLLMVAILPTNCKNVQMYLEPAVEMFAALKPGGDGFPVISPLTGQVETWYAMIALTINDMRGISKGNCQMQAPSKVNACNCCAVRGFHLSCYKTTMYPSAVTFLPSGHRLRREYRRTFSKCPTLRKMADVTQPRFFTDEYVRAAMDLAEQSDLKTTSDNHPAKKYGFYQRSCFVKLLDYWRPALDDEYPRYRSYADEPRAHDHQRTEGYRQHDSERQKERFRNFVGQIRGLQAHRQHKAGWQHIHDLSLASMESIIRRNRFHRQCVARPGTPPSEHVQRQTPSFFF